jgi:glucosyl-3-phosphoglycerate synthase
MQFTKAAFRRPFNNEGKSVADGGGRVTELMAKPLLNYFYPELTGFVQPLAGEFAAHRELLCSIPFFTGYGVEVGVMIDVLNAVGLPAMAQVDLGSRQNRHQPLWDLTKMSSTVDQVGVWALPRQDVYLHAVATPDGLRLDEHLNELTERPPLAQILAGGTGAAPAALPYAGLEPSA